MRRRGRHILHAPRPVGPVSRNRNRSQSFPTERLCGRSVRLPAESVRNLAEQALPLRRVVARRKVALTSTNAVVGAGGFEPPTSAL
jgi:hypothetical protein